LCAAENEFCECEGNITFGKATKDDKLNKTMANITKSHPKDVKGLMCSAEVFGSDPLPGVVKSCFCATTNATKNGTLAETDDENSADEVVWSQIKLIGNNDGRTTMVNTTERNITATLSTHISLSNQKATKRPKGNKRNKNQNFLFVQDNGEDKQRWKKETHPSVSGAFRLIDETGYCLWANNPSDFKRSKKSAHLVSVKGAKGKCTFWEKKQSGDGWNIVMARPGTKNGQKKFAEMNGWGLAVLGWCKKGECELGEDKSYLSLHSK
jgi:hypothetical protein